jgi:hypothetical protein
LAALLARSPVDRRRTRCVAARRRASSPTRADRAAFAERQPRLRRFTYDGRIEVRPSLATKRPLELVERAIRLGTVG